jgi:hypothetical protein
VAYLVDRYVGKELVAVLQDRHGPGRLERMIRVGMTLFWTLRIELESGRNGLRGR